MKSISPLIEKLLVGDKTRAELSRLLNISQTALTNRLERGYKKWTAQELLTMSLYLGYQFDYVTYYNKLKIDYFEEFIDYLPITKVHLAELMDMSVSTLNGRLEEGFTDIHEIQKLKGIINKLTPFELNEDYY